ncbi:Dabb family protein [Sulfurimonas autotrophica]|uniref:Stress responsive alpha-beta barrel domain protein n=1 Tax=Sulfurimonas autotrophica (strain ATCC BAA-671 / DSM 16294 / JCM 11897 / OK10) TaxID=563040 RepID=E0UU99_SULAO|nr:Dabb family protein [Sulfurimonas autotrophica]ADN09474.1 Stress responsive alpha-beta barrel domain protein [Sulfurimonas autotrophica DSM 16294]
MIVHIVMFKFKDENKALNIAKVKDKLESLEKSIDVLKSIEIGINFNESDRAMDLSLYSTFENEEDLKTYAVHEEHLKVVSFIKEVTVESKVVDYILE